MASADLWIECLHWFRRCGIALPDNTTPTQSLEFFSNYLRDGVLLCHLLHLLNPKALEYFFDISDLICMDPDKNEEMCLQNIEAFLQICRTDFGLQLCDLFQPKMLYCLTDFDRVLHTLSQLSKSPIVAQLGITEFPIPRRRSSIEGAELALKLPSRRDGPQQMHRSISSPIYEPSNEVMYMCILSDLSPCPRTSDTETLPNDPVERAVQKLLKAEMEYINILTVMEEKMFKHLSKILTPKEQTIIFYGIKELNQIHQQIQRELLSVTGNQENKSLTKLYIVFLNWKDKLNIYHRYAANLPSALHVVGAVYRGKKEVAREVENHEDYNGLKYASQSLSELEQHVNAIKKDSFLIQSLEHVQIRNLRKLSRVEQFSYQFRLFLQNCSIDEQVGLTGFFEDPTIPWTSSWRIQGPKRKTSFTFYSKTPEERLKWIESFKLVMAQLHPSLDNTDASTHKFELQTFSSVVDCHFCHQLLKGLLDQGYRCSKCGESFHKQCLESSQRCSDEAIYEEILSNETDRSGMSDFEQESGIHEMQSLDSSSQSGESSSRTEEPPPVRAFETLAIAQQVEQSLEPKESLESQLWFAGSMSALEATAHLIGTQPGTFLVRRRKTEDNLSAPFALSVMMECGVKHIYVHCFKSQPEDSDYLTLRSSFDKQDFFLVPGHTFPTINDLVSYYTHTFLSEEVSVAMDIYLKIPFKLTNKKINYTTL
ncbi:hypothetical protein DAPPUDRAFT_221220 [Daphnia pulex]|uniref:Uncharacterized protein n=1 Tax=Daphnia pulex TaxID=6669 RepID=E9FX29_DAPPU|nr:hypothetical protein DAPPUDRAFT_221220 [Daphnia pulex]|eukprot:EFX88333.1 hypothetical protein DAPPUDRAFT_221220 [Daphnia pulex]